MELTPSFNELLKARQSPPTRQTLSLAKIDKFLQDASSINRDIVSLHHELSAIRQAYLSTAAPRRLQRAGTGKSSLHQASNKSLTDDERNALDRDAKDMVRALTARIHVLTNEELGRQDAAAAAIKKKYAGGLRALGGWAAGGSAGSKQGSLRSPEHAAAVEAEKQLIDHRGSVIMYLETKLRNASAVYSTMLETRMARDMEKNRNMLAKARGASAMPPSLATELLDEEESRNKPRDVGLDITDEQRQMFERDNQDMLRHYNSATEKVKTVEKSLIEIAELQSVLMSNLSVQSANIEQLVADSEHTAENVGGGNKQLKKATERRFRPAQLTFYGASALCTFLVLWDLLI